VWSASTVCMITLAGFCVRSRARCAKQGFACQAGLQPRTLYGATSGGRRSCCFGGLAAPDQERGGAPGETAVRLAGEFTWDEGAAASLVDIDLAIPAGALVAVVGQTGSGKSSLLGAALGLMKQVQGPEVEVHGKARPRPG